jgi:hypothetical protein
MDLGEGGLQAQGRPIRPVRRHGLHHVGDGEDASLEQDVLAHQAVRVAGPVHTFMVLRHDLGHRLAEADALEDPGPGPGVLPHEGVLDLAEGGRLAEDLRGDRDLADVVDVAGQGESFAAADLVHGPSSSRCACSSCPAPAMRGRNRSTYRGAPSSA